LGLLQACEACPPGGDCEGKLRRPTPQRGRHLISCCQSGHRNEPESCLLGRVHIRRAFDTRQWNQRRRASDCRVPLDACLCWRWDVVSMLPRLHRYEVCLQAPNLPRPVRCKTAFQPRTTSGRTAPRVRLQVWRVRCWLLWRFGTMPRMRTQIARALSCLCRPISYHLGADVLPLLEW
jgi:hypothetical protein